MVASVVEWVDPETEGRDWNVTFYCSHWPHCWKWLTFGRVSLTVWTASVLKPNSLLKIGYSAPPITSCFEHSHSSQRINVKKMTKIYRMIISNLWRYNKIVPLHAIEPYAEHRLFLVGTRMLCVFWFKSYPLYPKESGVYIYEYEATWVP